MPSASTLITFVAIAAVFAAVPGPSNLFVVSQGLRSGLRPGLAAALGCASGAACYVVATSLGLAALLASSAAAISTLHLIGGAYLIFLGVKAMRASGGTGLPDQPPRPAAASFRQGVLVELSNPKVALFFLAFFPQFVHAGHGSAASQILVLGAVFVAIGLASDSIYACAAGALRARMESSLDALRRSERFSSILYFGLGGWAIWSGAEARS